MRRLVIALVGVLLLAGVATGLPHAAMTEAQPTEHTHHGNHSGCGCPHGHEHEHGGHGHTHGSHDAQPCHHAGQQPPHAQQSLGGSEQPVSVDPGKQPDDNCDDDCR
ncbi:hypothetical protein [Halosegnis longus]|uniref:hypothetical protein n=1 Tax=Halosegnis longus TaxID=2216012 RepID=UPI00096A2D86|nr:hypothetical protein [Salella cibi]